MKVQFAPRFTKSSSYQFTMEEVSVSLHCAIITIFD